MAADSRGQPGIFTEREPEGGWQAPGEQQTELKRTEGQPRPAQIGEVVFDLASAVNDPPSRLPDNGDGGDRNGLVARPSVGGGEPQSEEFPHYQAGGYPGSLSQNWQYEGGTVAGGVGQPGTPQGGAGPGGEETGGTVAAGLGIGPDRVGGTGTGGASPGPEASPEETP